MTVNEYGKSIALTANHILPNGNDMVRTDQNGLDLIGWWN